MLPPSGIVQKLDGVARDVDAGYRVAGRGFDFEPPVACNDLDLAGRAVETVAKNLRGEDVLAGRGGRELDAFRTHEQADQASSLVSVRRRGETSDRRLGRLVVDDPALRQICAVGRSWHPRS